MGEGLQRRLQPTLIPAGIARFADAVDRLAQSIEEDADFRSDGLERSCNEKFFHLRRHKGLRLSRIAAKRRELQIMLIENAQSFTIAWTLKFNCRTVRAEFSRSLRRRPAPLL
jgi:hypothetical protein